MATPDSGSSSTTGENLYFFPEDEITDEALREILTGDDAARRAWAISHLLRYAEWDDIWSYISREQAREVFSELDLPENLRQAWARMLGVEAGVS
jgi:hypothetical protein